MNRWTVGVVALAAVVSLAACGSSGSPAKHSTASSVTHSTTAPKPTPTPTPLDPNLTACVAVHTLISDKIQPTFRKWKPNTEVFNPTVTKELRAEATQMYGLGVKATGSVADAISSEAKGLTDLSVAMDEQDSTGVGTAANEANSALAQLRGVCNF